MRRDKLLKKPEHNHQTKAFAFSETQEKLDTRMSCCGGNCGCGAGCKCGAGCNGCGMYPDVEATAAAATVVLVAATHKGASRSSGGLETAAEENGGCDCSTCKCGTSCGCSCCSCN